MRGDRHFSLTRLPTLGVQAYARAILKVGVNSTLLGSLGFAPMMTRVRTRTFAGAIPSSFH